MLNIPHCNKKRVVILGCGFAGLTLARNLKNCGYQVVIIDKHNYHQFPPLFYQVASSGIEPDSILFPVRKIFQNYKDFYIRKAKALSVNQDNNQLLTSEGSVSYDYLVLAQGATNSFFGSSEMEKYARGMKTIAEVLDLKNAILMNFEKALTAPTEEEKETHLNIVIVGGGPSGVEISGALAEMNRYVLPKDYPELKEYKINIYLVEASERLLGVMSSKSSAKANDFLNKAGIKVLTGIKATGCDAKSVTLSNGQIIPTSLIIWTAGIKGNKIEGLSPEKYNRTGRIMVDRYSRVDGSSNIFAIGDISIMTDDKYPSGHPQVAPVAIQQAETLARNLGKMLNAGHLKKFIYRNGGTMATVGKNLAVVELPRIHFHGAFAWLVWMFVHLMSIIGVRNKLIIFINWAWKYFTYDQSLRLILRPRGGS